MIKLVVLCVILAVSSPLETSVPNSKIDATLVKNFAKINYYLEEMVNSDNVDVNAKKAAKWLERAKLPLLFDRSLKEALQMFIRLPEAMTNKTTCTNEWSRKWLEKCDEGLADAAHISTKNYPLRRIDRILDEVANKNAKLCGLNAAKRPAMNFSFKQITYDQINVDLVDRSSDQDPESNMRMAEAILHGLDDPEGSYARALKQLLALKTVLTEDSCNEGGTEVILKNDLATRAEAHHANGQESLRRITKLVHHYSVQHSLVCHPIYTRNCLALVGQLGVRVYRRVLALASAQYLAVEQFSELVDEVFSRRNGDEFSNRLIGEKDKLIRVMNPVYVSNESKCEKLFRYLKAATVQDPRSKFLAKVVDERLGERVVMQDKIQNLYTEYIHDPCRDFYNIMRSGMDFFDYNWRVIAYKMASREEYGSLSFRLLRSAFKTCSEMLNNREYFTRMMIEKSSAMNSKLPN